MKKIFTAWLFLWAVFFASNATAQISIGTVNGRAKAPEKFAALEIVSDGKGGLRLPQLTTDQRNALALASVTDATKKTLTSGLTILNTTTNCVEYWNANRWISLCEGTSQTSISPAACADIKADGTGCDQTFTITDPDCPNGPYKIAIIAGGDAATLTNVDEANGSFKIHFNANESISARSVLVRVTSTCTSQYKDFVYMQDGMKCDDTLGTAPAISPSTATLALCAGGAVYLSVPADFSKLDKLIWTRNGIEVARGVSSYTATLKGIYNVSLGVAGCSVSSSNERVITDSATAAPAAVTTIIASNNGVMCGSTGNVTLTAVGATGTISWFRNGLLSSKTGTKITVTGSAEAGNWFAAAGSGSCFSKPSNTLAVSVSIAAGTPITVADADVLVNNKGIKNATVFCAGGTLTLAVKNPQSGVTYTWYNGEAVITSPYTVPAGQTNMMLRMVASDNTGAACPVETASAEVAITTGKTPGTPTITGAGVICDGEAVLSIVPAETGTYTYQWYKNDVLMTETTQTITVKETGVKYSATVTNDTGCTSPYATKTIATEVSSLPTLSWVSTGTTANFGDKITYQLAVEHGPATYEWTADGGATITGSGTNATVTFPTSGTVVNIKVVATNACGASVALPKVVTLSAACPTPVVNEAADSVQNTTAGTGATVQVTVTSGNTTTYQWYKNTTNSNSGGDAISGATAASYIFTPDNAGTTYLYCIVQNGCTGTPTATSKTFTVVASANPSKMDLGSGTFAGKTCFDINKSNDGADCGTKASRTSTATDFATQYAQNYVFTASTSGTKKNLRFVIIDPSGAVESSNATTAAVSGDVSNGQAVTLTVNYKKTLSNTDGIIYGKTTAQAVKVQIYAVYNDGSKDVAVPVNVSIQDCTCCGAYVAAGVWKNFMCHNLGANTALDPITGGKGIMGNYYQWGSYSPTLYANGTSGYWDTGYRYQNAWGDTNNKGTSDPCPAGYKIPSQKQLQGIFANNTIAWIGTFTDSTTNYASGLLIGGGLYIPAQGYANNTTKQIQTYGASVTLWTSVDSSSSLAASSVPYLFSIRPTPAVITTTSYNDVRPLRCIQQ